MDDLVRERDILTKLKTQAENSSGRQLDLIKINEGTKRNLEQEIRGFRTEAQKQQRLLFQLEKEREKYGQEASESTSKHLQVCCDGSHLHPCIFAGFIRQEAQWGRVPSILAPAVPRRTSMAPHLPRHVQVQLALVHSRIHRDCGCMLD